MTRCPSKRLRFPTRTRALVALDRLRRHTATQHLRHKMVTCTDCGGFHLVPA